MKNYVPEQKKARVIINTDAKNEADDQFVIVQAALTPSFELHGFIAAHFGDKKSRNSMKDSYEEIKLLLDLLNLKQNFLVLEGAEKALENDSCAQGSDGAQLIIQEAMKDDSRPLHIAFLGPLTDMASAILLEPQIVERNVRVIWIGGGVWPEGGKEYNLGNDIHAANVVFNSGIEVWQIPRDVYCMMPVSHAELIERVYPHGQLGQYLTKHLIEFNNFAKTRPAEIRVLGDSPAIGVIMYPDCGQWSMKPAPQFDENMNYIHTNSKNQIKLYSTIDSRFIMEDFYAKLSQFNKGYYENNVAIEVLPVTL